MHERNELAQLLTQDIEKGLAFVSQPFENLVELRGIEPLTPRLPGKLEK